MASGIAQVVEARARERPAGLALAEGRTGAVLTWGGLAESVAAWTAAARVAGVSAGRPVAVIASRPLGFIAAYLGLVAAGAVVLPLDPDAPGSDLVAGVAGFGVCAVVTDSAAGRQAAASAGAEVWALSDPPELVRVPALAAGGPVAWADPATVVLRTSGTTGTAKGVPLDERRLLHAARAVAGHHGLSPGDRVYSSLPLFHVNAQVVGVLAALVSGAGLVVDARFHRSGFWEVVGAWDVTVLNAVPAILAILAAEAPPPESVARRLRFARSASSALPEATRRAFEERCGVGVLETYGMTEAAGQICANPLDPGARRPESVGRPVGIELAVVDEAGRPVDASAPGLVQIRGPSVTPGYVIPAPGVEAGLEPGRALRRRPACDAQGWLRTGDAGYVDADGFVYLMGRTDGVINRGGEKVYPHEVEEVLRRHAAVAEAAVVGEPDAVLGERPVAFVVTRSSGEDVVLEAELLQLCRRELSRHKRPARIQIMDSLPATSTGKVRRDQLRAMAGSREGSEAGPALVAPRAQ